jgi:hypothetical protein
MASPSREFSPLRNHSCTVSRTIPTMAETKTTKFWPKVGGNLNTRLRKAQFNALIFSFLQSYRFNFTIQVRVWPESPKNFSERSYTPPPT